MARRTTSELVRALLGVGDSEDVSAYIDTATKLVDKVETCAGATLDDQHLELIERWLAAHFGSVTSANRVKRKKIGDAELEYLDTKGQMGISSTFFGQQALAIDTSGCLTRLAVGEATSVWVGDPNPNEETAS